MQTCGGYLVIDIIYQTLKNTFEQRNRGLYE